MNYSNLIQTMENAWHTLQAEYKDIPDVLITVASGGRRAPTLYGHFAPNCWTDGDNEIHEVLIVAEQLKREPQEIFTTLLHEGVHGIAQVRGIKDVSNRRHNRKFRDLCLEVGLIPPVAPDSKLGFSAATISPRLEMRFGATIMAIGDALSLCRKLKLKDKDTPKTSWTAECECSRKIRVGKKTLEQFIINEIIEGQASGIDCGLCSSEFKIVES